MTGETRTCVNCKSAFTIESDDAVFYKNIGVPPPKFYWKCRFARRLIWRNERSLYKRPCDLCKKEIISMYRKEAPFPVYCHDCWWGDGWSPLEHGRDYDFSKPFFAQFMELQRAVPRPALYATDNVRSEYCNFTAHMKDSYLMFGSWFSEDCGYGQTVLESKDCWDCLFVKNSESCLSSFDCTKCFKTHFSENCTGCSDSAFLYDCRNCQNCIFSVNLRGKSYYAFNQKVSKEEYERIKAEALTSYAGFQKHFAEFRKMVQTQALHKFFTGERNQNVSGDFIYNSKNVLMSYYIHDGENEKYAVRGGKGQKDAMDVFGVHAGELVYDCNNIDFSSRTFFSVNGEHHIDTNYVVDSFNVEHAFGCISLRQKNHCVLNKQYGEKEFEALRGKIIAHMKEMPYTDKRGIPYSYGEFFPMEAAPFAYNESLSQEWLPITEKQAGAMGYPWLAFDEKSYVETRNWKDLPDTIAGTGDDWLSETILCEAWETDKQSAREHKCTKVFRFTPAELAMRRKFGVPLPRKCPNTRNFETFRMRNPVDFHSRKCQCAGEKSDNGNYKNSAASHEPHGPGVHCPNEFQTSYAPERPETVYCEPCYQAEVA